MKIIYIYVVIQLTDYLLLIDKINNFNDKTTFRLHVEKTIVSLYIDKLIIWPQIEPSWRGDYMYMSKINKTATHTVSIRSTFTNEKILTMIRPLTASSPFSRLASWRYTASQPADLLVFLSLLSIYNIMIVR